MHFSSRSVGLLSFFLTGLSPLFAQTPAETWSADTEVIGTGLGADNWVGTNGHDVIQGTNVLVQAISTEGAAQTGNANTIEVVGTGPGDFLTLNAWNNFDINGVTNVDTSDFSFRLFVSPDSLTGGMQQLLESGGTGDGTGIALINNSLILGVNSGNVAPQIDQTVSVDLSGIYDGGAPNFNDYLQLDFSIHPSTVDGFIAVEATNLGTGLSVSNSASWLDTDWDGGDPAGIGYNQNGRGGDRGNQLTNLGTGNPADWTFFDGQITGIETFTGLTVPEPSAPLFLGFSALLLTLRRRRS